MKFMKAAQFPQVRQVRIADIPKPSLMGEEDVLLKMAAVGICGSDIHYYVDGRVGDQLVEFPYIPGHECAAIVEEVGAGVSALKPGDRVAVEPTISCGQCDQCRAGRENTCRNVKFLGMPGQLAGGLCEYITMPEKNCCHLPDSLTLVQGAFAEPLSIAIYTLDYLQTEKIASIAILGSGPIGLSVLLEAKARGISGIYATDKIDSRLARAEKAGAVWTGNPEKTNIVESILHREPLGLDAVIECCGDQQALDQAVALLKPGGILLIVGMPSTQRIFFDASAVRRKEIHIQNVRRQANCLSRAIGRIASKEVDVDSMITHRGTIQSTKELYDIAADYRDGVVKAVVVFDG
jgi:L-iditol 2-dehydrogenase